MRIFLPYITSDHCPAVLVFPEVRGPKPKPFRFMNFIAEKEFPSNCQGELVHGGQWVQDVCFGEEVEEYEATYEEVE